MKKFIALLLLASAVAVAGPASGAGVAVILSDRVDDYQEALRGFKEVSRQPIAAEYNMGGDLDRGRKFLTEIETKVKPDLILAVGIWALQAIVSQPTDIPVVYAMVLNAPSIVGTGPRNMTGASINVPVEQVLQQRGPKVTGELSWPREGGELEGVVTGEVLSFSRGRIRGELTVDGDEMTGKVFGPIRVYYCGPCEIHLRREGSRVPPLSEPRGR